jgi:hypothetical protein
VCWLTGLERVVLGGAMRKGFFVRVFKNCFFLFNDVAWQCSENGKVGSISVSMDGDPRNGSLCFVSTSTDSEFVLNL